jgi:Protease inhibitor Inh
MVRVVLIVAMILLSGPALAQKATTLNDSAKAMIGDWEFSNADRDKTCTLSFKSDRIAVGQKLEFDANCGNLFPLVRDIVGWKYPEDDLLYLLDAKGNALIEFSEVEDGIFEAPTPGLGVLFLQNAAAAGPPPEKKPADVAGDWIVKRGDGTAVCALTLAPTPLRDGFALTVQPGCDPAIAKLNFTHWRLDRNELDLLPANGEPWRFEESGGSWRRLSETADQITLERQ